MTTFAKGKLTDELMRRIILLCSLLTGYVLSHANDTDSILNVLDDELDKSQEYIEVRESQIDSLRQLLYRTEDAAQRYRLATSLYAKYADFQLDSAFTYLRLAEKEAKEMGDDDLLKNVKIMNAWSYMQNGDLIHPMQFMERVDISEAPMWLKRNYYNTKVRVYSVLLESILDEQTRIDYNKRLDVYRDSAYVLEPQNWMLKTDVMASRGQLAAAIDTVLHRLAIGSPTDNRGIAYYFLARLNRQMKNTEEQKRYLALSAITDIRNGIREYRALAELASVLFTEGDHRRAFRYITRSMKDASDCNSKLRMVQISENMPIITAAYDKQETRRKYMMNTLALGAVTIALLLTFGLNKLSRKNRQLHEAHENLDKTNQRLKEANMSLSDLNAELRRQNYEQEELNKRLEATNKTRSEYLIRFIRLCHELLQKREEYRIFLGKVAAKRNFDDLYEAIRSTRYINEEISDFYAAFDEAFLRIYPTFVEKINALLRPEGQIVLKEGERLNTDLRIYALMRIGVTDSNEVCDFLRCSNSTFYNYRAKMRGKAISRETFEDDIMEIL